MVLKRHLFLLVFLLPALLPAECMPGPAFYGYRFLNPAVVEYDSRLSPFYDAFRQYYPEVENKKGAVTYDDNIMEWYERYCEGVQPGHLNAIIYGNTENGLQRLLALIGRKDAKAADLPSGFRTNTFASHLLSYRCEEVVEYLLFAKRCEPNVTVPTESTLPPPERRRVEMERLINEGLDRFKAIESHYVRLRYAYQIVRLAHYLKEHEYVLELYDYLMPKIDANPSIIYDWIEGHRAGALQALGDYPQSAYLYSRIFERCPSKRETAYRSFKIRTDEEWQAASNLCANDHERAMLHVLRAQNSRAVVVAEMDKIYAFEPGSISLEPLLMRELLELEKDLLGLDFNPNKRTNKARARRPRPDASKRLVALQEFVNRAVDDGKTANPELWLLARGVIEMLAGDYFYARKTFAELLDSDSDSVRQQVTIMREVMNVLALNRINDSVEVYYYNLLNDDELRATYPSLRPLVNDKLEAIYYRTGHPGKATLMQYGFDDLRKNPDLSYIKELENMGDSLLGNRFDKLLLASRVGEYPKDDINHLLGVYYLQRGQWESALEVFQRIPTARRDSYGVYAPFVKQFKDRVNFRPSASIATYNKVDLLERLLSLEDDARRSLNDTIAARNYFNIGLAHYNMSYYSYNWRMADNFRSGSSGYRAATARNATTVFSHPDAPVGNRENFSMDRARYYFERALSRAPSREAAAEAAYFLAKTERNQHYAAGKPGGARPFNYFRLLRDEYNDTRFYQTAVEECRTFAWFVGG